MRGWWRWVLPLALMVVAWVAAPAAALPSNPWTGQWLLPANETQNNGPQVVTLTQVGNQVTGSFFWCGGGQWFSTVSADNSTWTGEFKHPPGLPNCSSTGHGTFTVTMAGDGRSFSGNGSTDLGNG